MLLLLLLLLLCVSEESGSSSIGNTPPGVFGRGDALCSVQTEERRRCDADDASTTSNTVPGDVEESVIGARPMCADEEDEVDDSAGGWNRVPGEMPSE